MIASLMLRHALAARCAQRVLSVARAVFFDTDLIFRCDRVAGSACESLLAMASTPGVTDRNWTTRTGSRMSRTGRAATRTRWSCAWAVMATPASTVRPHAHFLPCHSFSPYKSEKSLCGTGRWNDNVGSHATADNHDQTTAVEQPFLCQGNARPGATGGHGH